MYCQPGGPQPPGCSDTGAVARLQRDLYGRYVYIVTGASSGIGRATAKALVERDCQVMVVARRLDRLQTLAAMAPHMVHPVCADLGADQGVSAVVEAASEHEAIDGLVHAAGSSIPPAPYTQLAVPSLAYDMAVHVAAPIALNTALQPLLAGGRVVYIDSYSATALRQGWSGYSIVKAAAQMAARAAVAELDNVSVIRLFPGGVRTPLVEAVLSSSEPSPTVEAFRAMDQRGELLRTNVSGTFISNVLLDATAADLAARETWDINDPADKHFT